MLLLASHRCGFGRDESLDHLADEGQRDETHDNPRPGIGEIEERNAINAREDIVDKNSQKKDASIEKANIIQLRYDGDPHLTRFHVLLFYPR